MFCRNCGKEIDNRVLACPGCGFEPKNGTSYCGSCGVATKPNQSICIKCGMALSGAAYYGSAEPSNEAKSKIVAGLLAIFLGGFGIHNFYLGFNTKGLIQLLLTLSFFFCGFPILLIPFIGGIGILFVLMPIATWVWSLTEGILIFAGKINKDAKGRPLKD